MRKIILGLILPLLCVPCAFATDVTYDEKSAGSKFTYGDANELKAAVNSKTDSTEFDALTAADLPVVDADNYWTGVNIETIFAEIGEQLDNLGDGGGVTIAEIESSTITFDSSAHVDVSGAGSFTMGGIKFDSDGNGTGITMDLDDSTVATTVSGGDYDMKIPPEDMVIYKSAAYTIGTDSDAECWGGVVGVTASAVMTACDNGEDGMRFTVINETANEVGTKAQSDDRLIVYGLLTPELDDGDKAISSTIYAAIHCFWWDADGWLCYGTDHTDGGQ